MWMLTITILGSAYLMGSIPFGYLAGRINGIDIRAHGSFNIGATNVLRVLGKRWGFAVFFVDALKGFAAVRFAAFIVAEHVGVVEHPEVYGLIAAAACVAGHSFPVWLHFKGGKGVATSAGAILGIMPIAAIAIFLVWLLVFQTTRYVSLASITAACALPVVVAFLIWLRVTHGLTLLFFSLVMTVIVLWRHRSNFSRLLHGTEQRFLRK